MTGTLRLRNSLIESVTNSTSTTAVPEICSRARNRVCAVRFHATNHSKKAVAKAASMVQWNGGHAITIKASAIQIVMLRGHVNQRDCQCCESTAKKSRAAPG